MGRSADKIARQAVSMPWIDQWIEIIAERGPGRFQALASLAERNDSRSPARAKHAHSRIDPRRASCCKSGRCQSRV